MLNGRIWYIAVLPIFVCLVSLIGPIIGVTASPEVEAGGELIRGCEDIPEAVVLMQEYEARASRQTAYLADIERRQNNLELARSKLASTLTELRTLKRNLRSEKDMGGTKKTADIDRLVSVFDSMKPSDAANIIRNLPPNFAAELVMRVQPQTGAKIIAAVEPKYAAVLATYMGSRNIDLKKGDGP